MTSALVGVAGSFIGYHLCVILGLAGSGAVVLFVAAIVGVVVILWCGRQSRFDGCAMDCRNSGAWVVGNFCGVSA